MEVRVRNNNYFNHRLPFHHNFLIYGIDTYVNQYLAILLMSVWWSLTLNVFRPWVKGPLQSNVSFNYIDMSSPALFLRMSIS